MTVRLIPRTAFLLALLFLAVAAPAQSLAVARSSARQGHADLAIAQAQQVIAASPRSVEAHTLLCQLYGSIDHFDEAIQECEAARDLQPGNSAVVLDLALAYGAKADHAGSFTGMRMVGRIRENFERAAQLDPKNIDALSDLGEFYVEAPGVVGGGVDKARPLVQQLAPLSPARSHRLAAMIAAKSGDTATAEKEFGQELAISHSAEAYVDLANFDRRRKQFDSAEHNALLAIEHDPAHGPDSVDAARLLLELKRGLPRAEQALRDYLSTPQASTVSPVARVHTQLGNTLAAAGNSVGAQSEYAAALAEAKDYAPARKASRR